VPVILVTQEAGIRRIKVQSQPGQLVGETPSQRLITEKEWWSGSRCRPLELQKKKKKKKTKKN
jgi:hypothetical protein